MLGSRPCSSRNPASSPSATAVPIVSKKSESMTVTTAAIAGTTPSVEKKPNENSPTRLKSGVDVTESGTCAIPGPTASQIALSPQIALMIAAITVVATIAMSRPPRIPRTTRMEANARPIANVSIRSVVRLSLSATTVPPPRTTTPAFTSPITVRNSPMPIAIARFRSIGIAFTIAFRSPVRTRRVITSPSTTITPIASG